MKLRMVAACAALFLGAGLAAGCGTAQATPGAALTPPMGINLYNEYGPNVTEAQVKANAAALVSSGLATKGYNYVILDGGWAQASRVNGHLVANSKFPDGIAALASYVHGLGLKFGIYESAGTTNCAGNMPGGYPDYYGTDAADFAVWGVDYVKFDYCDVPGLPTSALPSSAQGTGPVVAGLANPALAESLADKMAAAIAATGRPMVLDIHDANGSRQHDLDWQWGQAAGGNLWSVACDINASYLSIHNAIFGSCGSPGAKALNPYAGPDGWNDPDMLEVGNGVVTKALAKTQLSLWAEEAAPLIIGHSINTLSSIDLGAIGNTAVISVDQDPLGRAGHSIGGGSTGHWVLTKALTGNRVSVVLFNATSAAATISTTAAKAGMPAAPSYRLQNVWGGQVTTTSGVISHTVNSHAVVMFIVSMA
jgi:alpha-galactosidase